MNDLSNREDWIKELEEIMEEIGMVAARTTKLLNSREYPKSVYIDLCDAAAAAWSAHCYLQRIADSDL